MELSPRYKQTEVGIIPDDWDVVTLSEVCGSITDGTHFTPRYVRAGVPFYSVENITADNFSDTKFISAEEHSTLIRRCKPERGDILLTRIGSLGETKLLDWDVRASIYVSLALLKLNDRAVPQFVNSYTQSPRFVQAVERRSLLNAAPKKINMTEIGAVPIPLPRTKSEQRAIAGALGDVDGLIGALTQVIAKKRDLKQAAMQQLLTGQTRLPDFSGEWEVVRIADVANVKTGPFGSSLHERDYVQAGTPIITVEHLGEFGVMHSNLPLVSDTDRQRLRAYSLETGDIVFSRVGSVDRNALIRRAEAGWLFSGRLLRVRPDKEKVFAPFLSYQFQGESFKRRVRHVAVGQTMASLNTQILNGLSVALPTLPEQTAIAAVLSDMDAELAALEQRLAKTRALKQGMMQELLTGRTRLV